MATLPPSSLDSRTLARRLGELAGDERRVQVEFLLHLDQFDRRRAFLELGYGSLWTWCLEVLQEAPLAPEEEPHPRPAEMRAVSEGQWSLRVTIDGACKDDLETLAMMLSHKFPRKNLAAVLHEAIRCGIEKHGNTLGADGTRGDGHRVTGGTLVCAAPPAGLPRHCLLRCRSPPARLLGCCRTEQVRREGDAMNDQSPPSGEGT